MDATLGRLAGQQLLPELIVCSEALVSESFAATTTQWRPLARFLQAPNFGHLFIRRPAAPA